MSSSLFELVHLYSVMHAQMEQTGSTLFQTLSGLLLDSSKRGEKPSETSFQYLLNIFLFLNLLQFTTIVLLTHLQYRKDLTAKHIRSRPNSFAATDHQLDASVRTSHSVNASEDTPLLSDSQHLASGDAGAHPRPIEKSGSEVRRGLFIAMLCVTLVVSAWILFMITAWYKLGQKRGQH